MLNEYRYLEVDADNFQPIRDLVYIEADPTKKEKRKYGSLELQIDTSFKKYDHDNVVQDGIVRHVPTKVRGYEINLEPGDHVYTHHFLCDEENAVIVNYGDKQVKLFKQGYLNVYCKVKDGEIEMMEGWNFFEPVYEDESNMINESGIYIKPTLERISGQAIARHLSPESKALGLKVGDKCYINEKAEYEMIVEGTPYYRVPDGYIIGIIQE